MSDENLLITSSASNKRSLTEHFVDYVKKSKCIVPCTIFPKETSSSTHRGKLLSSEKERLIISICSRFIMSYVFNLKC